MPFRFRTIKTGPFKGGLILLIVFVLLSATDLHAQRKDILMAQPDGRFTVFAQRYWSSMAGSETYFFYVQNNTEDEYTLSIKITLHLACEGAKTFQLGYGGIRLKPKEMFRPANGGEYSVLGGNTDAKKACRMKDGDDFTFLKSATYHMTDVVNVTAQKRAEAKKKADQDEERRLAEDERKKLAEQKLAANNKNTSADDFWNDNKKQETPNGVPAGPNLSKVPEFFQTADGRYWKKDGNSLKEISYDGYMSLAHQKAQELAREKEQSTKKKLTPEEQKQLVDKIKAENDAAFEKFYKPFDEINYKFDQFTKGRQVDEALAQTKSALKENSNLNMNVRSVEELEAEFNQKMANINSLTNDLAQQRNAQVNVGADMFYSEPQYQSVNEGVKLLGSIVNGAKQAKERKEMQEQLRQQRQIALNRIAAEEKRVTTELRTDLFSKFQEAAYPTSSTRVSANTLYFFSYAYDQQKIGEKAAILHVSNVFGISKYSDGTWPFKNSIMNQLTPLTPYREILHGYYSSAEEAESMRAGMMKMFSQTGGGIQHFSYKGKKAAAGANSTSADFWENGKKPASDSTKKTRSDFWDN